MAMVHQFRRRSDQSKHDLLLTDVDSMKVGRRARWKSSAFTWLQAESVKEPIHRFWFIPKIPDDMVGVSDESSERVRFADRTEIPYRIHDVDVSVK